MANSTSQRRRVKTRRPWWLKWLFVGIVAPLIVEIVREYVHSWKESRESSTSRATEQESSRSTGVVAPPGASQTTSRTTQRDSPPPQLLRPVTPEEAAKRVDQVCAVEIRVNSTKSTEFYLFLNSKKYKESGNFAIAIKTSVLPEFKQIGIDDAERHFFGKTIVVTGTVSLYEGQPQIRVYNIEQIRNIHK
ncbi:MAG TPA: hypothetical protein VKA46_35725 [Gemmataceae bacterium]|nr:hypothetical protein [Gemmataceae bacterium]